MVYALVVIIGEGSDENLTRTPRYEHYNFAILRGIRLCIFIISYGAVKPDE
jgi:hypothetical protein